MAAKTAAEIAQEFAQAALGRVPVIILGSGASAAHGIPGMTALATQLQSAATPPDWTIDEQDDWKRFLGRLTSGDDLETALQKVLPTSRQTRFIANETRAFLLPGDRAAFNTLIADRRSLPLSRLYRHLFNSTHETVHVVTPNYDRLAEYAADAVDVTTFVGFGHGYLRQRARADTRIMIGRIPARTVCVWKVHGSLDWFQDEAFQNIAIPAADGVPGGYAPLMITPGIDKYRLTHVEPFRTILGCCDAALEGARAYFCVGYGFNDEHLQSKLVERCDRDSIHLVIIAKELTRAAKAFLTGGRCKQFLAIEEGPGGGTAYMHDSPGGFPLDQPVWQLDQFLDFTGVSA